MTAQNVLVIHLGSTNSRSFLFNLASEEVKLISSQEMLTTDDKGLVVASLKSHHKGQFEEIILVDNERCEQEAFVGAVKLVSADCDCLAIDLGSKKTLIGQGSFGRVTFKKYDLGVGESVAQVLKDGRTEDIARFLSASWKFTDIENNLGQISLYPGVVPAMPDYLELVQATARQVLTAAVNSSTRPAERGGFPLATPAKVILTGAVFGKAPKLGQALLTFLDGVEPEGVFQLFVDKNLMFCALGGLISTLQDFDVSHLIFDILHLAFINLGSVLVLSHQHSEGTTIASLSLDLGLDEKLEVEVKAGEILRVPFAEKSFGQVKLGLRSGVEIAGNEQNLKIEGGNLGFIIDARGRPLPRLPINEEGRQTLKKWREALEC